MLWCESAFGAHTKHTQSFQDLDAEAHGRMHVSNTSSDKENCYVFAAVVRRPHLFRS